MKIFLLSILLSATFSTDTEAQSLKTLCGRVRDATSAGAVGAKVRLENAGRSFSAEIATERFSLASSIGYVRARQGGIGFNQFFGSLSLGAALMKRVGSYFEVYGFTRVEAETRRSARFANGGLTYLVNKNFQLDARLGVGLGNHTAGPDYFFGFAKRF